eukprot:283500_1
MTGCGDNDWPIWYTDLNQLTIRAKVVWNKLDIPLINQIYTPTMTVIDGRKKKYFLYGKDKLTFAVTVISDTKSKIDRLSQSKMHRYHPMCCKMKTKNRLIVGGKCKAEIGIEH